MSREPGDIPDAFLAADEWARAFGEEMMEGFGSHEEVTRRDTDLVKEAGGLWPNASGGVVLRFSCDVRNAHGSGYLPKRLQADTDQLHYEALKDFLEEHPRLKGEVAILTDPRRRPSLYEYGAQLGKTPDEVDHDVGEAVWNLRDELTDREQEELYEHQDGAIEGSYDYGIDIAYLDTNDRGNPWREEPLVEITLTFLEPGNRTSEDLARRYLTLDACGEGANQLLAQWAIGIFHEQ